MMCSTDLSPTCTFVHVRSGLIQARSRSVFVSLADASSVDVFGMRIDEIYARNC